MNSHDPEAEEKFKEAAEAYEILSDAERRADLRPLRLRGARVARLRLRPPTASAPSATSSTRSSAATRSAAASARGAGRVQGGDVAWRSRSRSSRRARGDTVEVEYDLVDACERCHGNRAEPGTPIETCARCDGAGRAARGHAHRVRPARARAGLRRLRRRGQDPAQPCEECGGRGRKAVRKTLDGGRARRDRRRAADPAHRPRPRRRARRPARATSTCSCAWRRTSASCATATTSSPSSTCRRRRPRSGPRSRCRRSTATRRSRCPPAPSRARSSRCAGAACRRSGAAGAATSASCSTW